MNITLSIEYADIDKLVMIQTEEKNRQNNAVYRALIAMLKDGQQIFKGNIAMRRQFTFSYLLKIERGSGVAGFKGYITAEDGFPLFGVAVKSSNDKYSTATVEKGRFQITRMEAGEYTFIFSKEGYQTIEKKITIKPGITHNIDLILKAEVMLKAA